MCRRDESVVYCLRLMALYHSSFDCSVVDGHLQLPIDVNKCSQPWAVWLDIWACKHDACPGSDPA